MNKTKVSIVKINQESIYDAVKRAVDLIGGFKSIIKNGDKVFLKPNLAYPYPPPATTDPRVVEAVTKLAFEAGAKEVEIGDSSAYSCKNILGVGRWTNKYVLEKTGMYKVAEKTGAKIIDFDTDDWKIVEIPNGVILKKAPIAKSILDADVVINIPALKMHFETQVTLGIKNYHGILPDHYKVQWHKDEIMQKIVDLHKVVKTHLTIMDGLVGMEGLGPRLGKPVEMNLILASEDVVSLDAVATEVMGMKAWEVESTRIAHSQGIGNGKMEDIVVVGEKIKDVMKVFERPDVSIDGIYPFTIIKGGPCIHCYGRTKIFIEALLDENLANNADISTIFVGINPKQPDIEDIEGNAVFVGDCAINTAANVRYALGDRAICVNGCPPIASVHREIDMLKSKYKLASVKEK